MKTGQRARPPVLKSLFLQNQLNSMSKLRLDAIQNMPKSERFSCNLKRKTRAQNRNKKQTEIERFDWFIEQIQTRVAFGWFIERSGEKKVHARELSRNQPILRFDVILEHDWLIEQCPLYIRIFFCGKTKRPSIDFSIHWLIKQITNSY